MLAGESWATGTSANGANYISPGRSEAKALVTMRQNILEGLKARTIWTFTGDIRLHSARLQRFVD